jgi:hypothetical protein
MSSHWIEIDKKETASWNEKLKATRASFFQYPYYASGYKDFFLAKPVYLKLIDEKNAEKAFCTILRVNFLFFKVGLVIRGPVMLDSFFSLKEVIANLKRYAKKSGYTFLRINPDEVLFEDVLKSDIDFQQKNYFPVYNGSQDRDFNIYQIEEDKLLKSFRTDCRNKIRFSEELNFEFSTVKTETELKSVYALFEELGNTKGFKYRPYKSYREIFNQGLKEDLCSVYMAKLDGEIISSTFIVKDAVSYNCLSGALMLKKNLRSKYSPSNKMHYLAVKDCFYKDNKQQYNLSYSAPDSGVYMFKDSFHPKVDMKPDHYTFVINKKLSSFLLSMQQKRVRKIKSFLRNATNMIKR